MTMMKMNDKELQASFDYSKIKYTEEYNGDYIFVIDKKVSATQNELLA